MQTHPSASEVLLRPSVAARRLGCSRQRTYTLAESGRLQIIRRDGHVHFLEHEVEALRLVYRPKRQRRRVDSPGTRIDGLTARVVFEAFRQGASLVDIVIAHAVSPRIVRELWREFRLTLNAGEQARFAAQEAAEQKAHDRRALLEERAA